MKMVYVDKVGWSPYYTIPEDKELAVVSLMKAAAEIYFGVRGDDDDSDNVSERTDEAVGTARDM